MPMTFLALNVENTPFFIELSMTLFFSHLFLKLIFVLSLSIVMIHNENLFRSLLYTNQKLPTGVFVKKKRSLGLLPNCIQHNGSCVFK